MAHSALYTHNWTKKVKTNTFSLSARLRHRLYDPLSRLFFLATVARTKIKIQESEYPYFVDWYNYTWTNERTVEISYFSRLISQYSSQKVLEIGNTLGHYQTVAHTIVDKYERGTQVVNVDVLDFMPRTKFDLILSISTFEHIGWHEKEKNADKALRAIAHSQKLLSSKGILVFSFPLGVNPALDQALKNHTWSAHHLQFLRRKNGLNMWEEASYRDVKSVQYNSPYPNANAICIVTMKNGK